MLSPLNRFAILSNFFAPIASSIITRHIRGRQFKFINMVATAILSAILINIIDEVVLGSKGAVPKMIWARMPGDTNKQYLQGLSPRLP